MKVTKADSSAVGRRSESDRPRGQRAIDTLPEQLSIARQRRGRAMRRSTVAALATLLVLAAFNAFGVRTSERQESAGGVTLAVTYAPVSRPGLVTPFAMRVGRSGGFGAPVELVLERDYLRLFSDVRIEPAPLRATAGADTVIWTFAPPAGDVLEIDVDGRIDPGVHAGARGSTAVRIEGGPRVVVAYRTRIVP
jgi:hypothetical protein